MVESNQPRGFTRVYIDLDPQVNDQINTHCKETGITKKFFFYRLANEFFNATNAKVSKHGANKKRR